MFADVAFGLCALKVNILRIPAEYSGTSHLTLAFVYLDLSTRPTRTRGIFSYCARGCMAPAARPASLHVCMCRAGLTHMDPQCDALVVA
jgi:hypothetical protein